MERPRTTRLQVMSAPLVIEAHAIDINSRKDASNPMGACTGQVQGVVVMDVSM